MSTQEIKIQYLESVRNMDNAREILRTKAGKEDGYYQYVTYVKKACKIAYKTVLLSLEVYLVVKGIKLKTKSNRLNVDNLRRYLSDDREMLNHYNNTWDVLHCNGYLNGSLNPKTIAVGMESADVIINAIRPDYLN